MLPYLNPIILSLLFSLLPNLPALPNPDPATIIQPFHPTTTTTTPSPPSTIPSFPEQSTISSACSLHLPDALFPPVRSSCGNNHHHLRRSTCCPVLAAWLYSAYSHTALGIGSKTTPYDQMPMLPDDSESCVDGVEDRMREKGLNLVGPNQTCDVVYCFCGIRLHPLTCPRLEFHVSENGTLTGGARIQKLEKDCLSPRHRNGCSKCLRSLHNISSASGGSRTANRRREKMRDRECELMGLTWLLNKNRDKYISTVTAVMRVLTVELDGSHFPRSCSVGSDGMPLAVDSVQIDAQSSAPGLGLPLWLCLGLLMLNSLVFVSPLFLLSY